MIKYLNRWEVPQINFYASHHKAEIARKIPISSDLFYEMIDPMTGAHYKKLYAGTIYPSNDSNALGIVVNDYYSYEGEDMNVAICVHGAVSGYKLPITATDEAKTAMKLIEFRTQDYAMKPTMVVDNEIFEPGTKDILTALIILSYGQWLPIAEQVSNWTLSGAKNTEIKSVDLVSNNLVSVKIDVSNVEFDTLVEDNNKINLTPNLECTTYKGSIDSVQVGELIGEYFRPYLVCYDPIEFNIGEQETFTATVIVQDAEFTDVAGTVDGWTLKTSESSLSTQVAISSVTKVSSQEVTMEVKVTEAFSEVNDDEPIDITLIANEGTCTIASKFVDPCIIATVHKAKLTCSEPKTFTWGSLSDLSVELELENASYTDVAKYPKNWTITATGSDFAEKVAITSITIQKQTATMNFALSGKALSFTSKSVNVTVSPNVGTLSVKKVKAPTIATINVPDVSLEVPTVASIDISTTTAFTVDVNILNTTLSDNATNVSLWKLESSECNFPSLVGISSITKKSSTTATFSFDISGKSIVFTSTPANISITPLSGALIALPTVSAAKIIELTHPDITYTASKKFTVTQDVTSSATAKIKVSNTIFTDAAGVKSNWKISSTGCDFADKVGITGVTKKSNTEVEFYFNTAGESFTFTSSAGLVSITPTAAVFSEQPKSLLGVLIGTVLKS